ncbi:MAG: dipeptidase [Bifidobacteriaceae bacterium]|jgi:membrane dipeptidase|nr:dipeptidase [Bifidobacteriaceae bacterium]
MPPSSPLDGTSQRAGFQPDRLLRDLPEFLPDAVRQALSEFPVFDGHNDLPAALRAKAGYSVAGLDQLTPRFQTDLVRLRRGGVGAQFWSAWVPSSLPGDEAVVATLEQVDGIERLVAAYPDHLARANTAAEVRAAWRTGRIASLIGIEGGHSIGRSLGALRAFARLGVRYLTLTHATNTPWADSATDSPAHGGLTDEGRAVVRELNRLGVLVDLSHTSADTQRDALAVTGAPLIFSHSSAFAVNPHPRNVPDDVLELLRRNGGVVQATFVPAFISQALAEWETEARQHLSPAGDTKPDFSTFWKPAPLPGETFEERARLNAEASAAGPDFAARLAAWQEGHPRPEVTVDDVVRHVEHLREVAGVDHIGLGGDYDGTFYQPTGLEDVSGYPRLLTALAERHWSAADLGKLTGGNVLRVLEEAEGAASDKLWPGAGLT